MCEFLERMRLTGMPTEEVRKWSGMTHRVVELTGPFPTPDEMRVELWLHEESATRLLDMCDWIDAEFHKVQAENAKLRELVVDMMGFFEDGDWCVKCERARDCQSQEQYEDDCLMRFEFRDRMRELGIEVD